VTAAVARAMSKPEPLVVVARRHIVKVLRYTGYDVREAAHILGIGQSTLYRRLDEFQIRFERGIQKEKS